MAVVHVCDRCGVQLANEAAQLTVMLAGTEPADPTSKAVKPNLGINMRVFFGCDLCPTCAASALQGVQATVATSGVTLVS